MRTDDAHVEAFYRAAAEFPELLADIFVAVPCRPDEGVSSHLSCKLSIWFDEGVQWSPSESFGGFIEVKRMQIAHDFLKNRTQKFLLMIDNDTEPIITLPWLLARHDKPVVGSCIASLSAEGRGMLCFSRADPAGIHRFIDFEDGDRIPATGLAEVPHCGTGAMMIRRDVLEAFTFEKDPATGHWDVPFLVPDDVKARGMKHGLMLEGEDIRFCKQARAKGFKVHVDLEAHCGHRKTMRLTFPQSQRDPSLKIEDWVASPKGMALREDE